MTEEQLQERMQYLKNILHISYGNDALLPGQRICVRYEWVCCLHALEELQDTEAEQALPVYTIPQHLEYRCLLISKSLTPNNDSL